MNKEIEKILKKIEKHGFKAYIVGGYVRNYLMGIKTFDVDIATSAKPKDLINIFPNAKYNQNYGTIKIITNDYKYDITTFRKENYFNNQIKIDYVDNFEEDFSRRDFTINSIYMDRSGSIYDPTNGLKDLQNKNIIVIGQTSKRFQEDPLRILRGLRFKIELDFKLDKGIIDYIKTNGQELSKISYFRKKEELNKIFSLKNKLSGLNLLKEYNLLKPLDINFNKVVYTTDPLGMWSQIEYSDKYPFTKEEKYIIKKIKNIKKLDDYTIYQNGLYISLICAEILEIEKKKIIDTYKNLPIKNKKDIKINYKKLVNLGYAPNKINDIINFIEKGIIFGKCKNNYKSIKEYLQHNWK